MTSRTRASLAAVAIIIIATVLSACGRRSPLESASPGDIPNVKVIRLAEERIAREITTFGSVSFLRKADVTASAEGIVRELGADEGAKVRKGQLLARLSNTQLSIRLGLAEASLAQAEASLEQARVRYAESRRDVEARLISIEKAELQIAQKVKELDQTAKTLANKRELYAVGGVTDESMQSMELGYESSQASLEAARKDLAIQRIGYRDSDLAALGARVPSDPARRLEAFRDANTRTVLSEVTVAESRVAAAKAELESARQLVADLEVRSPLEGIVAARYLEIGEKAQADSKLFTVFESGRVDVVFHVPESVGLFITEGLEVGVTVDALGPGEIKAKVRRVSPMVDPQSGNITVKALLPASEGRLRPGMFARVRVAYGKPTATLLIPTSAVLKKSGERAEVFLAVNGRAFKKEIVLGESVKDRLVVREGLKAGDSVIDSPSPLIREGEEINATL